jgi:Calcineurin-like phosphoesterase
MPSCRPVSLELVTLTEDRAILTWCTGVPGPGEVVYGTHPRRLNQVAHGPMTAHHYLELTGLEPGRTYYYQARSGGATATSTPLDLVGGAAAGTPEDGVFAFTTPQPPPGRFLFSIALCNDLHLGESVAGLIHGHPDITGISQPTGAPPYPEIMAKALVTDARHRGASYLIAAGDVSNEAAPADLTSARELLDGFGAYRRDYFVARGNHDRAHHGAAYATCGLGQWQGRDCFRDGFFTADEPTYLSTDLNGLHLTLLDTYDKAGDGGDPGGMSAEQFAWFQADLKDHRDQPTLVVGHHPLITKDVPFDRTGGESLGTAQSLQIAASYARSPGVFLHHAGHTHRNKRALLPGPSGVVHQEVGAVKEYPGGFTLLRVHTGGYALNFYKTRADAAREWSERSRQMFAGLWPQFSLGSRIADRNSVVARDLSGLVQPTVAR